MDKPKRPRRTNASDQSSVQPDIPLGVINNGAWTSSYFRNLIRGALRRIYFRFPGRLDALKQARIEKPGVTKKGTPKKRPEVWYACAICGVHGKAQIGKANPRGYTRMWVDHDPPLVPLDAPTLTWSEYVERLFCTADKLRVLCNDCHYTVTQEQNAIRREYRNALRQQKTSPAEPNSTSGSDTPST